MQYELTVDLGAVSVTVAGEDRGEVQEELLACIDFVRESGLTNETGSDDAPQDGRATPWATSPAGIDPDPDALAPVARKTGLTRGTLAGAFVVDPDGRAPPGFRAADVDGALEACGPDAGPLILLYLLEECYPDETCTLPALLEAVEPHGTGSPMSIEGNEYIDVDRSEPPRVALTQAGRVQARERLRAFVDAASDEEIVP